MAIRETIFIVIPTTDLLGGTPSVARATEIVDPFPQIDGTLPQVAVAPDTSGSGVTSLCYDASHPGLLKLFDDHRLVAALDIVGNFRTDNFQISYAHGSTFLSVSTSCDPTTSAANVRTDWPGRPGEFVVPG
jgi:hypothetical protein